jgi:hypothetical protein
MHLFSYFCVQAYAQIRNDGRDGTVGILVG